MKPKFLLLIVFSAIIFTGLIGAITFQNIFPTTSPFVTNESTVNLSYGIHAEDGLSSITHSWNGSNTTLYDSSLVLFMNFDNRTGLGESNTLVYDISGNGHNGTVSSATWALTNGRTNGGFTFDGVNDWINLTTLQGNSFVDNVASFSFWINSTLNATNRRILGIGTTAGAEGGNGLYIRFTNVNSIQVLVGDCNTGYLSLTATNVIPLNTWTKVDIVLNGTSIKTYINGTFYSDNNATTSGLCFNNTNTTITLAGGYSGTYFNGSIDDFMIFNKSLSSIEINELHKLQITRFNQSYFEYNTTKTLNAYPQSSFLCSANSTGYETCSATQTVQQTNNLYANFSTSKGTINDLFYGVNTHGRWGSEYSYIDIDGIGVVDTISDYEWHRSSLLNANLKYLRADMDLFYNSLSDGVFNSTVTISNSANIDQKKSLVTWAKANNIKILFVYGNVPDWLANKTSGICNSSRWSTCPPTGYNLNNMSNSSVGKLVTDFATYVGCTPDVCEFEIGNEFNLATFWLYNVTNRSDPIISLEYNKLFNATSLALKDLNSSYKVGGPATTTSTVSPAYTINVGFFSNFSNITDFFSFHDYRATQYTPSYSFNTYFAEDYNWIFNNITTYNGNVTRVLIDEYNIYNTNLRDNDSARWGMEMAIAFEYTLNTYPTNVSLLQYEWAGEWENYYYWQMVSEAGLDNVGPTYYITYNVTKNFAHLCPSQSQVYVTSNNDDTIKQVSCKKGNMYSLIVINTDTNAKNITANLSLTNGSVFYPYTSIMNYETGSSIPVSTQGIIQLGVLDSYEILYLVNDSQAPTITINSPSGSVTNVVNYWFNVTLDEEGSWCGYSINGGTNVTMTQQGVLSQFKYLANIPNGFNIVTFYCNDTYGNMATASTYITGLTPSGAGTGDVPEIPTTENEDGSSGAEELSLWDKIVAFLTEKTNEAREELIDKEITGQVIDDIPGEKTFMEKYIWLFIGLFLFMILVLAGRKGRI